MERLFGVWRSLVARLLWEQEVGGSNPSTPTMTLAPGHDRMKTERP